MQDISSNKQITNEGEIEIIDLVSKLWKKRSLIIRWCVIGAVIGLIVGFSIPKTYKASVTFAPETQQKTNSSVSSIASMMGVNLNNNIDAISVEMFPDVVHSTPFIFELLDLPVTFERKDSVITAPLADYIKQHQKAPWWDHVLNAPFNALAWVMNLGKDKTADSDVCIANLDPSNLPKSERNVVNHLSKKIQILVEDKTGKTSISLTMQDPLVVSSVMTAITENLQKYMSDYRTSKARQDVVNLEAICEQRKADYYAAQQAYAKVVDANQSIIRQSAKAETERLQQEMNLAYQVYSQVATQLEGARIQVQQAKPVFVIIEPVTVPIKKSAPSKSKILVIFTFLAGCGAASWILFGKEYWKDLTQVLRGNE